MIDDNAMLRETYRLAQDNNRMLHAMRRTAFFGGFIKIVVWIAVIATPIWFYMTYLAPVAASVAQTVGQAQGASKEAQAQVKVLQDSLKRMQAAIPSFGSSSKTATTSAQ